MNHFYTEIYINASTQKVWNAFLLPDEFFMAFYQANIKSSFEIGERIEYAGLYEGKEVVHIYGKILEYEEGKLLAYTDHPGPMYHPDHAKLVSRIIVKFEAVGGATKLCLTNDQFSENNPMQEKARQWYLILSNLKTYIETGKLISL